MAFMRYIIVRNNKFNFIIYKYALNINKIKIILLSSAISLTILIAICNILSLLISIL